ncbi:MAG: YceI family protein [Cyclobacteriaceae bacterium]
MKKIIFIVLIQFQIIPVLLAQKFISTKSHISFFSEAPVENVEAHTYQSKSTFDTETGEIVFTVPVNSFQFKRSLMQKHFNEKYIQSDKYPRSRFKGKVTGFTKTPGKQDVTAEGLLEIHGVTKRVSLKGVIDFSSQKITVRSSFPLRVADYKVKIPKLVFSNVAEVVDVTVEFTYVPDKS